MLQLLTIIYCSRSGLPLRGHRDDSKYHPEVGLTPMGLLEIALKPLISEFEEETVLEDHLRTCGKNRLYISKTSQNKLIICCGDVITDKLVNEVKESTFYTI